jgi:hypothetical protein
MSPQIRIPAQGSPHLLQQWSKSVARHSGPAYIVIDLLHGGRSATVAGPDIARTVDAWMSELGIRTRLSQRVDAGGVQR